MEALLKSHIIPRNMEGSLYQVKSPAENSNEGYTLYIDDKVATYLKYLALGAGALVMLTQAPVIGVASMIVGYAAQDLLKDFNQLVQDTLLGNHCSNNGCVVRPVLTAIAAAATLYFLPLQGLTATAFSAVAGQAVGAYSREQADATVSKTADEG